MPDHARRGDDETAFPGLRNRQIDVAKHRFEIAAGDVAALQTTDDRQPAAAIAVVADRGRGFADVPVK